MIRWWHLTQDRKVQVISSFLKGNPKQIYTFCCWWRCVCNSPGWVDALRKWIACPSTSSTPAWPTNKAATGAATAFAWPPASVGTLLTGPIRMPSLAAVLWKQPLCPRNQKALSFKGVQVLGLLPSRFVDFGLNIFRGIQYNTCLFFLVSFEQSLLILYDFHWKCHVKKKCSCVNRQCVLSL